MKRLRVTVCTLSMLAAVHLHADEGANENLPALWEMRLVAFGQDFPAYPSSSDQNVTILPIPYPMYRGKILRFGEDLEDIANSRILSSDRVKLSIGLNASFPEDSDNLSVRTGMPDLDLLVEAGPDLKIALKGGPDEDRELKMSLQVRGAISLDGLDPTGRGFIFNPELEYLARDLLGPRNELRFRVAPAWASRNYMNYFYGVVPEFATPSRPQFDASSGYLNTEFLVGLNRKITDRLELRGSVRLWVNKGAANDASPLYRRDYDHGIRLALFWTAWESKRRAASAH
jgi:outer membrane scaffolding protein for murein synthesis (MipA/OmpV family)